MMAELCASTVTFRKACAGWCVEHKLSRQKRSSAQTTGEMRAHLGSDGRRTTFSRALTNSSQTVPASCGRLGVHDAYRDALRKGRVHEASVEPRAAVASWGGGEIQFAARQCTIIPSTYVHVRDALNTARTRQRPTQRAPQRARHVHRATSSEFERPFDREGRSVFELSGSGWPGAPKAEGGGEKTKTRKQRGPQGRLIKSSPRGHHKGVKGWYYEYVF